MRWTATIVLMLLSGACGDDGNPTTGGAGSNEGGAGGTGGIGGAAGGGGSEQQGGAGGASCDPAVAESCEQGLQCVVVQDALGVNGGTACQPPGDQPASSVCSAHSDCALGLLCEQITQTCKAPCSSSVDCDGAACVEAFTTAGLPIPGIKLCLAECDPVENTLCAAAGAEVSCVYRADLEAFDCARAGDGAANTQCDAQAECAVGLGCLEVNGQTGCLNWCEYDGQGTEPCTAAEAPGAVLAICVPQLPSIASNGVEYGACLVVN